MLWFRVAAVVFIFIVLIWASGVAWGVIQMFSFGGTTKSMVDDPSRNGTVTVYICLTAVEILIMCACIFGLVIAFRMWRNNYQIDHSLRHLFIVWLGIWGVGSVICLSVGIFMLVKGKDNQENMAVLYDTFQKNSQDPKFVSTLEKYQRENQCCGVYSPDDWFMLQLRQAPQAGGGGGGYQSLDYGFRQNPSTGKCHMVPPTIPPGCGLKIMEEIQFKLKIYAAASVAEVIIAAITGALSWYCFFYWLEKEVIVIPEDEVSNVIIIEPESEATVLDPGTGYLSRGRMSYLPMSRSRRSHDQYGGSYYHGRGGGGGGGGPVHRDSRYLDGHRSPHLVHLSHEAILREQEEALGGRVLAEMHVEHKQTKMLQATGSKAGQHHATIAIVRNKHPPVQKDLFPKKIKGHHGQTGNLAQDITDMSGGNARGYIEDVVIPVEPPGMKPHAFQIPVGAHVHSTTHDAERKSGYLGFGSQGIAGANKAEALIEGFVAPDNTKDEKYAPSVVVPHPYEINHVKYLPPLGHHHGQSVDHGQDKYLHQRDHRYLEDGGRHRNHERYLQDGGRNEDRYLNAGGHRNHEQYLQDGSQQHDRYLNDGSRRHERYLQDGGGHHNHERYLQDGGRKEDRYLKDGGQAQHWVDGIKTTTKILFKSSRPLDDSD